MILIYKGVRIWVEFSHNHAYRAPRDKFGQATEPDLPESVDLEAVVIDDVDITAIVRAEVPEIEKAILEKLKEGSDEY
jgi:hypothetical protein